MVPTSLLPDGTAYHATNLQSNETHRQNEIQDIIIAGKRLSASSL
jgi:hypothetical protein